MLLHQINRDIAQNLLAMGTKFLSLRNKIVYVGRTSEGFWSSYLLKAGPVSK